ncbi:hypothetical protein [uncultured Microscilla sp.]|uniref:hypothetical protein n=1 Tax=uncultured Microscilla sp. TaxID=432653 RepID=UPI0026220850|nr:hypothetical protein [uncultured Microscilla sp.]
MYTQLLIDYLAAHQRLPYIKDTQVIKEVFERNRLKITDELLDFQLRYAGYFHKFPPHSFVYGLLHKHSEHLPALDLDFDDDNPRRVLITCMDCHPLHARALDARGVYYKDYAAVAENFTKYLMQRALFWRETQTQQWQNIHLAAHVQQAIREEQNGKIEEFMLPQVSDKYSQIYHIRELMIKVEPEQIIAWKVRGSKPQLFYFSL